MADADKIAMVGFDLPYLKRYDLLLERRQAFEVAVGVAHREQG